jgi:hypothetical protein
VKTLALFVVALAVALPVTVFVYLLTTQVTPNLFVDIGAAGFVCAVVVRLISRVPWRWSFAVPLALALVLALPTVKEALLPPAAFSDSGLAAALERTTIPLKTVRAGSGSEDLEPLVPILTGRRIVALGEATHGTREFFQMKHRLLEFLVKRLGFRHYGMELSAPDGEQLDQFIHGKDALTSRSGAIHTFSAGPAPDHYYAHALARLPSPIVFLDVARLRGDPVTRRWIELDQSSHHFQELHVVFRLVPSWHTDRTSWTRRYDGLVFVRDTTPAVGLP